MTNRKSTLAHALTRCCLPLLGWGLVACGAVPIQITVGESTPAPSEATPTAATTPNGEPQAPSVPPSNPVDLAQSAPAPGLLTAQEIAALQPAQIPIMVPTFLPPGTILISVEAMPPSGRDLGEYVLRYKQPDTEVCIAVEAAGGGFGGPVPSQQIPATLPPWAQNTNPPPQLYWTETGEPDGGFPFPALFSDWIESDQGVFYRVTVPDGPCQFPSPAVANQVLASLRPLP